MTPLDYGRAARRAYFGGKDAKVSDAVAKRWALVALAVLDALAEDLKQRDRKPRKRVGAS